MNPTLDTTRYGSEILERVQVGAGLLQRMCLLAILVAFAAAGESAFAFAVAASPGTRWERGDQVLFFGDYRRQPGGPTPWCDQLILALPRLRDDLELSGRWMGCGNVGQLPGWTENWYANNDIDVAVIVAGAADAEAEKPPEAAVFEQSLLLAIRQMVAKGAIVVVATPMPCGDRKTGNPLDARLDAFAAAVKSAAATAGAHVCDLRAAAAAELLRLNPEDKPDGVFSFQTVDKRWSLTAAGHIFAAERIAAALGEAMAAAPLQIRVSGGSFAGETKVPIRLRRLARDAIPEIRYSIDGKDPAGRDGRAYKAPVLIRDRCTLKVWAKDLATGRTATIDRRFDEIKLRPADKPAKRERGLRFEMFSGRWKKLPDLETLTPVFKGQWNAPDLDMGPDHPDMPAIKESFALRFSGLLEVPCDGVYTFYLGSDDGSRLTIGDTTVIDHDGIHDQAWRHGEIGLREGLHQTTVIYFQAHGSLDLRLQYEGPGIRRTTVPDAAWWHDGKEKPRPLKPVDAPNANPSGPARPPTPDR